MFWAYNGCEVFYEDEILYSALDEINRLRLLIMRQPDDWTEEDKEIALTGRYVTDYKNYQIVKFSDKDFDIEKDGELVDGGFQDYKECKIEIDRLLPIKTNGDKCY